MADRRRAKAQRSLRESSLTGALVNLSNADEREVAAECLVELLTTRPEAGVRRWVRLRGAEIVGTLDLAAATLVCALWLEECQFTARISFAEAHAPAIRLLKCRLIALEAEQLHTRGSFVLDGSDATGGVSLPGAHIGGQLTLAGATLTNHSGPALIGEGLQVDGQLLPAREGAGHGDRSGTVLAEVLDIRRSLESVERHRPGRERLVLVRGRRIRRERRRLR